MFFAHNHKQDTKKGYMYLPPKCKQFSFSFGNALPPPQTNFGQATTLTFSEMNGIATKEKVASKNMAQNKVFFVHIDLSIVFCLINLSGYW